MSDTKLEVIANELEEIAADIVAPRSVNKKAVVGIVVTAAVVGVGVAAVVLKKRKTAKELLAETEMHVNNTSEPVNAEDEAEKQGAAYREAVEKQAPPAKVVNQKPKPASPEALAKLAEAKNTNA